MTGPGTAATPEYGPFGTDREAHAAALRLGGPPASTLSSILSDEQCRYLLAGALAAAGVELGDYDRFILAWLGRREDATCAVIAGWVSRAAARERADLRGWNMTIGEALRDAIRYREQFNSHRGNPAQVRFYIVAARELGIELRERRPGRDAPEGKDRRAPMMPAVTVLDEAQLDTVLDALDDAAEYRHDRGACADCDTAPDGLCGDHAADLDRASRYAANARQLRMEAGK